MNDKDNIELPPLPPTGISGTHTHVALEQYATSAVLADRERRAKVVAVPVVHSRTLDLCCAAALVYNSYGAVSPGWTRVTLRWTADGRAWIESARNRELARKLRFYPSSNYDAPAMHAAAAALDGGER